MVLFGKMLLVEVNYLGHSSFRIRSKGVSLLTDPFLGKVVGLPFPKVEAEIVTVSHEHEDHNAASQVGGNPFVISGPGEYEVKGILVFGTPTFHDAANGAQRGKNTVYTFETEGMRVCHLGDLGHKLTEEQLMELNGVDILFVPVGGIYTLDPQGAIEVISQIEPKIVIPMHYRFEGISSSLVNLATVDEFLKAAGEKVTPLPKLVTSQDKLPEERQIVVLERRG